MIRGPSYRRFHAFSSWFVRGLISIAKAFSLHCPCSMILNPGIGVTYSRRVHIAPERLGANSLVPMLALYRAHYA